MFFKLNRIVVLSFVTLFSLLVSNASFGTPENDLLDAIQQDNYPEAESLLKIGVDFQQITSFSKLPITNNMSNLLLRYGLGLERFLGLVMGFSNSGNDDSITTRKKELIAIALKREKGPKLLLEIATGGMWKYKDDSRMVLSLSDLEQEYYVIRALEAGASFSDIKEINGSHLPSPKVAELMLENSLDPTVLLKSVLGADCRKWNSVTHSYEIAPELVTRKYDVAKLILETKKVDFDNIGSWSFGMLPSIELSELLLGKGLNLEKFLGLVMASYNTGQTPAGKDEFDSNQKRLVELALEKGVKSSLLLNMVVSNSWEYAPHHSRGLSLSDSNRGYYTDLAFKKGAKLSEIEARGNLNLSSLEAVFKVLENPSYPKDFLDPNELIVLALRGDCSEYNPEKHDSVVSEKLIAKRNDLIKLVLKVNANPDRLLELAVNRSWHDKKGERNRLSMHNQEDVMKMALDRGAKFSNIKVIGGVGDSHPPSIEAAKLMLNDPENSLSPNDLLNLAVSATCKEWDSKKQAEEIVPKLVAQRDEVLELALANKADPNKIRYFNAPPSIEISKKLLDKYRLDPNTYLNLVSRIFCMEHSEKTKKYELDIDLINQRNTLIELAKEKGASAREIDDSHMLAFAKLLDDIIKTENNDSEFVINVTDEIGKTLLMLAAEAGYIGFVEELLMMKADRDKKDKSGKTALDLAREVGNSSEYLEDLLTGKICLLNKETSSSSSSTSSSSSIN